MGLMTNGNALRQEMIVNVLAAHNNDSDTGLSAGGIVAWERLIEQLSPLIGETGLCALYARASHIASGQRHAHPAGGELRSSALLLEALSAQLSAMDSGAAHVFNTALLETFTRLLAGLIGEALTARLLKTAWAEWPDGKQS